jgi:hypothetical protein
VEITALDDLESLTVWAEREGGATMYQLSVYAITSSLWRWEIRCGGALRRCGTAPTKVAAETHMREIVST